MKPSEFLETAAALVSGDRAEQYGDYTDLHQRAADMWSAYLETDISAEQVVFCMTLLKVARNEKGKIESDNGVDASAYTALWAAIMENKDA